MDISGKVNNKAREEAKVDRDRLNNPPEVVEGMEDGDFWDDNPFENSGGASFGGMPDPFGSQPSSGGFGGGFGGDPFGGGSSFGGSPFGGSPLGGGADPFGLPQNQQQEKKKEIEDVITDGVVVASKGIFSFSKVVASEIRNFNAVKGADMFRQGSIVGLILFVVFLVLSFFSRGLLEISALGALVTAISLPSFAICYNRINSDGYEEPTQGQESFGQNPLSADMSAIDFADGMGASGFNESDDFDETTFGVGDALEEEDEESPFEEDVFEEDEEDIFGEEGEDDWEAVSQVAEQESPVYMEPTTSGGKFDSIIASMQDKQLITRQVIYDTMMNIMPSYSPNYYKPEQVPEHKEEFDNWDAVIKQSAEVFRPSNGEDKDMPHLIKLEKKLFYFYLVVSRSPWIKKVEPYVDELVRFVAVDEDTGKRNEEIVGSGEISGDKMYIRIMQPSTQVIGLRDAMEAEKEFFLNPKTEKPVVLGITEEGKALTTDFKSINSLLVAGMPRSGKTVQVECIFTSLCMFLPPSEMNIIVLDPKDGISDFLSFDVPHVKRFETSDNMIVKALEDIVHKEGSRRKELCREAKVIKIQDYNKKNPTNKMPVLYVLIDEVLTLAERMEKDVAENFQSLLTIIVSQLPALGIHLVMIPHVIKDAVVSKTTSDLMTCRISVRGTPDHIEKVTGSKPSQFKRKLVNVGDMAINMGQGHSVYAKGVLSALEVEERQEILDFVRDFWLKLEPESYHGSYYHQRVRSGEVPEPSNLLNLEQYTTGLGGGQSTSGATRVQTNTTKPQKLVPQSAVVLQSEPVRTVPNSGEVLSPKEVNDLLEDAGNFRNQFLD